VTPAFCSRIAFSRTRNLTRGDGFCNHQYRYLPSPLVSSEPVEG
jgi:hypothetical protein